MRILFVFFFLLIAKNAYSDCQAPSNLDDLNLFCKRVQNSLSVSLDPSSITPFDKSYKFPCPSAFEASYVSEGRTVTFLVEADHVRNPISKDAPMFAMIRGVIQNRKPGSLLLEIMTDGNPLGNGASEGIAQTCLKNNIFSCGEGAFAAYVAGPKVGYILGGEPTKSQELEEFLKVANITEIFALESTKIVTQLKRDGVPAEKWPALFAQQFEPLQAKTTGTHWSYGDFTAWLKKNMNGARPEDVDDSIYHSWLEPNGSTTANAIQKISYKTDLQRERAILKAAEKVINQSPSALIIYGRDHFPKEAAAFEKAFGKPTISCLAK